MFRFEPLFKKSLAAREKAVDTNTEESRIKRAINQYAFEKDGLQQTHGKPFRERFFASRQAIFKGFKNVQGEDVAHLANEGKIVSDSHSKIEGSDQFVPLSAVAESAMVVMEAKIDEWYQKIVASNSESIVKQEVVQRFLAILYVAGVTIQPTTDGNKQTFKVLLTSYMHDLLPETVGLFPPMQQTDAEHTEEKEMGVTFVGGAMANPDFDLTTVPVPPLVPTDKDEIAVLDALVLASKTNRIQAPPDASTAEFDALEKKKASVIFKLARVLSYETKSPIFNKVQQETIIPSSAKATLQRAALEYFTTKTNHDYWQVYATVFSGTEPKIARASYAVKTLWASEEGIRFVESYIFGGKLKTSKGSGSQDLLFWKASNVFEAQRVKMWQVMETEAEHDQIHAAMLVKYRDKNT